MKICDKYNSNYFSDCYNFEIVNFIFFYNEI